MASAPCRSRCFSAENDTTLPLNPCLPEKNPLARYLYIYVNKKPGEALDAPRAEFIKYILSRDGQTQTEKGGYYPITEEIREAESQKLGLSSAAK